MRGILDTSNQAKTKNVGSQSAVLQMVREWKGTGHSVLESLGNCVTDIEKREQNLIAVAESVEKRLRDLEDRERKFDGRKSALVGEGGELGTLLKDFTKEVELREEKLDERMKVVNEHIQSLEAAQNEVHGLKLVQREKLKKIEEKDRKVDLIQVSLEKRLKEIERREKETELLQNEVHDLKLLQCEKLKEIEGKESKIDSIRGSLEKRLREVEQREKESESFQNELQGSKQLLCEKSRKIEEKEREIDLIRGSLDKRLREVELTEEKLGLLQNEVQSLKLLKYEKLKEIEEKERGIDLMRGPLEKKLREVEQREKELESFQNITQGLKQLLCEKEKEIEEKEKEMHSARGSLENRLREVEQREKEAKAFQNKAQELTQLLGKRSKEIKEKEMEIKKRLSEVEQREKDLESFQNELPGLKQLLCERSKKIEEKEIEIDSMRGSLEERVRDIEQREKELDLFQDRKWRELVSKEELLNKKREEFIEYVDLAEEKFREQENMECGFIKRLESMLEGVKATIDERFEEIESWEAASHNALIANVKEAELIQEQLQKLFEEFVKMVKYSSSSQEDKMHTLELKDQHPSVIKKELLKEIKLVDEKIAGQQTLGRQLLERLEELTAKKLSEMGSSQLTISSETYTTKDSCSNGELMDVRLQELERREEEFHLHQAEREREHELEEKKLRLLMEEFIQEVKYREEKFDEQEKKLCGLLSRLELAQRKIEGMNKMVKERFEELSSKEDGFDYSSTEKEMNELLESKTEEMRELKNGIKAKENGMVPQSKELEFEKQNLEMYNLQQRYHNSNGECALNELHQLARYHDKGEPSGSHLKEHELKRPQLTHAFDAPLRIKPVGSVDLDQAAEIESLEMVINNNEKELELMADEVFKVLLLSPDPAKLVLNAMERFNTPQFRTGDMELNVQVRILILDQLTKMLPKIGHTVREAALKLANEWKSTMRIVDENPLQVLEFLHLLAAYNLPSFFSKEELLSYLKVVAQHKQTPELCHILGLTDEMHVFVQNLINEKQYLLASTYIYECELGKVFPQAAVLDFYMEHVRMLGKAERKKEYNSSEAHFKAIFDEIADLRIVIEHIVKHGLELEYSPDIMMERIKQLECEMTGLKNGIVSSVSTNKYKQEKGERSSRLVDANKGNAVQNENTIAIDAAHIANAQLPEQDLEGAPFGWRTQGRQNSTRKRSYNVQEIKPFHRTEVNNGPVRYPRRSRKRHRASPRDFWHHDPSYEHHRLGR